MRSFTLARTLVLASLSASSAVISCPQNAPLPSHYKLVDLGTFGGPDSSISSVQHVLSSNNVVIGKTRDSDFRDKGIWTPQGNAKKFSTISEAAGLQASLC